MGRQPKPPELRQRRNKAPSAATIGNTPNPRAKVPPLPRITKLRWRAQTREWWRDVWTSPMAARFLPSDRHALNRLAVLVNQFWAAPTALLANAIRSDEARFGLTPLDRWRLQWREVPAQERPAAEEKPKAAKPKAGPDPREMLRLVPKEDAG